MEKAGEDEDNFYYLYSSVADRAFPPESKSAESLRLEKLEQQLSFLTLTSHRYSVESRDLELIYKSPSRSECVLGKI